MLWRRLLPTDTARCLTSSLNEGQWLDLASALVLDAAVHAPDVALGELVEGALAG